MVSTKTSNFSFARQLAYRLSIVFAISLAASPAMAQSINERNGQQSIKIGEADLYPSVKIGFLQDDNAFRSSSNLAESQSLRIQPELAWYADRRLLAFEAGYLGDYFSADEDATNYADHKLYFRADAELTKRKRVNVDLEINASHEDPGINLTRGTANSNSDLVQFVATSLRAGYTFGAKTAKGNVTGGVRLRNLTYSSRSDLTNGRDSTEFAPFAQFSLRVGGSTRAFAEVRYGLVNFSRSTRDRQDLTLLTGLKFAATGKTGGQIALGVTQSSYDLSTIEDQYELVAEGDLFWEPTKFSKFTLSIGREIDGSGSAIATDNVASAIRNQIALVWDHEWSSRLSHKAFLSSSTRDRVCPDRDSTTTRAELEFNLSVRRWLTVGASAASTGAVVPTCSESTAIQNDLDYDKATFGIHFRASL